MEEDFTLQDGVLTLKPLEDGLDSDELVKSVVYTGENADSSKMNSIEIKAFINDEFSESEANSKQIIVQRIDDFIDGDQFKGLKTNLSEDEFPSEEINITIIQDNLEDNLSGDNDVAQIVSEPDIHSLFQANISKRLDENQSNSITSENLNEIFIKEEPIESDDTDSEENPVDISSSSLKQVKESKSLNFIRKKQPIRIDKDDPRSRLHFVKYMKKDGKIIKLWECGICEKEFRHQYTLTRHLPTHTDERNYKCIHCGKAFRQMSTLAQHKATHSESRPYVCDICTKTFSRVSTLISHKKIHTDNKPHVCHICGKGFHQKVNLKNHFYTHTNERPYKCDICGRGFNQASNLQCHKLKTHVQNGNVPQVINNRFKCSHCSESFSRRAQLRHHEEHVHDVKNVFSSKNSLKPNLIPSKTPLLRKKKLGNIRIIQMPPDDDDDEKIDENETDSKGEEKVGILIEPIDTKAMHKTLSKGHIPFALLKPAKGSPVVVKVQLCDGSKHMLVPATASELKSCGKFYISSEEDGNKTVQIKVPVVATIHQRVDENGDIQIDIEPPSDEESDKKDERTVIASSNCDEEQPTTSDHTVASEGERRHSTPVQIQHFILNTNLSKNVKDGSILAQEINENVLEEIGFSSLADSEELGYGLSSQIAPQLIEITPQESSVDLVSATVTLANEISSNKELDNTVQYLRPTENIGEYEVIVPEENSLFGGSHNVIQHLKPLIEDNETMTVDQSHLAALMNALQTAGYEMQTDEVSQTPQIILNTMDEVDDAIIVDNQHIQMVVSDEQEMSSVNVTSMTIDETEASDAVLQ